MSNKQRILIVDDEPLNVDYLQQELEDLDCATTVAQSGQEALTRVASEAPDLILLDIMMPGMSGFEVLSQLKANDAWRDIPVVVVSALDDMDSVVKGIELGAEDYLPKPFDPVLLRARIGACLEKKRLRDQEVQHLRRINEELALAWQVQSGFLPAALPNLPGWQFAATLEPSRETSGDFYDLIMLPNGHLGILVADVVDKGMGAALLMVLSRTLIRGFALQFLTRPEVVLAATNRRILQDINTHQFVTIFYGILNPTSGKLVYCNAGHNPPYLLPGSAGTAIQALGATGMPVGIEATRWGRKSVQLAAGDLLLLYTDGLTEAQNAQQEFFGEERVRQFVQSHRGCSALDVEEALMDQVHRFMGRTPRADDITVAVVAREAA
jgi:sigma-B regulation protein RsbU (phosphoserine phosphatase)